MWISIPATEAIATIGAKDALAHLLFAVIGPGDAVVSPNPAYPIHQYGVVMAEGHACMLPMPDPATFLNGLRICTGVVAKPKLILISFPHNPTTDVRGSAFFRGGGESCPASRVHDRPRFRVCGYLLRRLQGAEHPAGSWRKGSGGRDLLDVEELQHGGLARRVLPRESEDDRGARAHQELSRLRRVSADSDRVIIALRECEEDTKKICALVSEAAGCAGQRAEARRLGGRKAARIDVRVGADSGTVPRALGSLEFAKLLLEKAQVAVSPESGSDRWAKATSGSR
jgi:alanine-synthesizing transaminase